MGGINEYQPVYRYLIKYKGIGTIADDRGVTFGIVNILMSNYLGKCHTLYMDDIFLIVDSILIR